LKDKTFTNLVFFQNGCGAKGGRIDEYIEMCGNRLVRKTKKEKSGENM
jgi:hypothetical protein